MLFFWLRCVGSWMLDHPVLLALTLATFYLTWSVGYAMGWEARNKA